MKTLATCATAAARLDTEKPPYEHMDMELSKKTTILFSPQLHDRLTSLAEERHTSLGDLVRTACEKEYGSPSLEEKFAALDRIAALNLPVPDVQTMKRESIPSPKQLKAKFGNS